VVFECCRVAEQLDQGDRAIRAYKFVANAWRAGDPELQPYVVQARSTLDRLSMKTAGALHATVYGRRM
jgi:hypothetical protein